MTMKNKNLFGDEDNGASFSTDRKFRFCLWRKWDDSKPSIMFIGLNPSTANETGDDPTIRRVKKFASDWGYGGVYMMNCFAFVSTNPKDLKDFSNNESNNKCLKQTAALCDKIIFAWGNFDEAKERGKEIAKMFPGAFALEINKNGSPKHPLYVPGNVIPIKYNPKQEQK